MTFWPPPGHSSEAIGSATADLIRAVAGASLGVTLAEEASSFSEAQQQQPQPDEDKRHSLTKCYCHAEGGSPPCYSCAYSLSSPPPHYTCPTIITRQKSPSESSTILSFQSSSRENSRNRNRNSGPESPNDSDIEMDINNYNSELRPGRERERYNSCPTESSDRKRLTLNLQMNLLNLVDNNNLPVFTANDFRETLSPVSVEPELMRSK